MWLVYSLIINFCNFRLKLLSEVIDFIESGNLFQRIGPENDRLVLKRSNFDFGMIRFFELYLHDAFFMMLLRYGGVFSLYILCISTNLLNSSCFFRGNIARVLSFWSVVSVWLLLSFLTARLCIELIF